VFKKSLNVSGIAVTTQAGQSGQIIGIHTSPWIFLQAYTGALDGLTVQSTLDIGTKQIRLIDTHQVNLIG
jgi:hypothetical protein